MKVVILYVDMTGYTKSPKMNNFPFASGPDGIKVGEDFFILEKSEYLPAAGVTHVSRNYVICLIRRGSVSCCINSKRYVVNQPCLALFPPGQTMKFVSSSNGFQADIVSMSVNFGKSLGVGKELRLSGFGNRPCGIVHPEVSSLMKGYLDLCRTVISSGGGIDVLSELSIITTAFFYKLGNLVVKGRVLNAGFSDLTGSFLRLVEEKFREHRSLEWYAGELCKSPKYLSRIIRQETGKTASAWIDDKVCDEAKALLMSSSLTISQISDHLGFSSQSYFGKFFKRMTGASPVQFRKTHTLLDGDEMF